MTRRFHPLAAAAVVVGAAGLASSGCGHRQPPLIGDPDLDASAGGTSSGGFDFDAQFAPPKCEVASPDGGVCGCTDVPLVTDTPNLYLVLDRSGSMTIDNKWTTVRNVVAKLIQSIGPRANFGAAAFPSPGADNCTPGSEIMSVRRGDSPAGYAGPVSATLLASTNYDANGGTPTAATLSALAPRLGQLSGRTYVILATDGGPNCDDAATCDVTSCIVNIESAAPGCFPNSQPNCCDAQHYGGGNCLDTQPTVAAVASLKALNIPTYVVGVPGSAPYASVLDQLAVAGGTARAAEPLYYRVDTADESALLAALGEIAAKIVASCTLPLGSAPSSPDLVNVYIDEQPVPKDATNGWSIEGSTVTLLGTTCDRVLSGSALDVRVVVGCPTIGPK